MPKILNHKAFKNSNSNISILSKFAIMNISIDINSGFCFGVVNAIKTAEDELKESGHLYCLGEIVHNNLEIERLQKLGLEIINKEKFVEMKNCRVLIRAHGEPPETYEIARKNNIELIDTSCPIVLNLQKMIKISGVEMKEKQGQVVIFGKKEHAEVIGLNGQIGNNALIINDINELDKIDCSKPIRMFSQTTKSVEKYKAIAKEIENRAKQYESEIDFIAKDTICRKVSNRALQLKEFAKNNDVVVFVSGKNSSNGNYLFSICKSVNAKSYFVSSEKELEKNWFSDVENVGVGGATSTPMWLMEKVAKTISEF